MLSVLWCTHFLLDDWAHPNWLGQCNNFIARFMRSRFFDISQWASLYACARFINFYANNPNLPHVLYGCRFCIDNFQHIRFMLFSKFIYTFGYPCIWMIKRSCVNTSLRFVFGFLLDQRKWNAKTAYIMIFIAKCCMPLSDRCLSESQWTIGHFLVTES